jgi:hypothetical protein
LQPSLELLEQVVGAAALGLGLGDVGLVDRRQPGVADETLAVAVVDPLEGVERVVATRGEAGASAEDLFTFGSSAIARGWRIANPGSFTSADGDGFEIASASRKPRSSGKA